MVVSDMRDGVCVASPGRMLSRQALSLWAKTVVNDETRTYSTLVTHLSDTGECAALLWNRWLPESIRVGVCKELGVDTTQGESLVRWLGLIHDIGKATPSFQFKVPDLAENVRESGLRVPNIVAHPVRHTVLGEVLLEKWLAARGWKAVPFNVSSFYGSMVGSHHGAPPANGDVERVVMMQGGKYGNESEKPLGDSAWWCVQNELLDWAWAESDVECIEDVLRTASLPDVLQIELTALMIMADWIASNSDLFPPDHGEVGRAHPEVRANRAWSTLNLPASWSPPIVSCSASDMFHQRFEGLPSDADLRPSQKAAVEAAEQMEKPGMIIIEAPMGEGKTEASLMVAEILMGKFRLGGVAYLLPTQATSNAMFSRVLSWLTRLPREEGESWNVRLAHGKAELNPEYRSINRSWRSYSNGGSKATVDNQGDGLIAHQWFGGSKRSLLASFVVGTVDQLLMASLKYKHVQLRHLGLAGKVVIIDEVHAYDAYMSAYLERGLSWLGAYGVPVVLMSATLPPARRAALVEAYCFARGGAEGASNQDRNPPRTSGGGFAYPLITSAVPSADIISRVETEPATDAGGRHENADSHPKHEAKLLGSRFKRAGRATRNPGFKVSYAPCEPASKKDKVVEFELVSDDKSVLISRLKEELRDGGCACILRDTVRRAQETYDAVLGAGFDGEVLLMHSRFLAIDRARMDQELISKIGPHGNRPRRLIVVATQVIEQSLDIDFDIMVSDVAPVDLLLQRVGRLHRHSNATKAGRPERLTSPRCLLTGVEKWNNTPVFAKGICLNVGGQGGVYEPYLLMKSLYVLGLNCEGCCARVSIPSDISTLVERTYEEDDAAVFPKGWKAVIEAQQIAMSARLEEKRSAANTYLLERPSKRPWHNMTGWLDARFWGTEETEGRACVRDGSESVEVVVVQQCGDQLSLLPWIQAESRLLGNGMDIPDDEAARVAAACTVSLPQFIATHQTLEHVVKSLERVRNLSGWQESRWLRGKLPLILDGDLHTTIDAQWCMFDVSYTKERGLSVERREEKSGE